MFCSNCGTQIADDAKFCSKCGKPVSGGAPAAPTTVVVATNPELDQLHQDVKAGLECAGQAQNIIRMYEMPGKIGLPAYLQKAEELLGRAQALLAQIGELKMVKGLDQTGRWELMTREYDYQRFIVRTETSWAMLDYIKKDYVQAVTRIHGLMTGTLPKESPFMKELTTIRQQYLDKLRSKDFNQWKAVRKDVMHDEVRPEELSFTEKHFN